MKRAERTATNGCPALNKNEICSLMSAELITSYVFKGQSLVGKKFNRLSVIEFAGVKFLPSRRHYFWECKCDCGNAVVVSTDNLTTTKHNATKSCGCLNHEVIMERNTIHGYAQTGNPHKLFMVWSQMRQRCGNPKHKRYADYGRRGIFVDQRWDLFQQFFDDMFPTYSPGLTIKRKNNDGPYSKENCCWATMKQQCQNQRPRKCKSKT